MRDCQITAINNLEESFRRNHTKALIQMATGSGKTFTAVTAVYRLLKHAKADRVEFFDFIVIDECNRSIYNLWKQVLDYFDAFLIGLTVTPDNRIFGFFNQNVVSEYAHEQAITDGINVGSDVFLIETDITKKGSNILWIGQYVT